MVKPRFRVGTNVMCNLGPRGWKPGRVIMLQYREEHWPNEKVVPYQVKLEEDQSLIYVPEDNDRFCREISPKGMRKPLSMDGLTAIDTVDTKKGRMSNSTQLDCAEDHGLPGSAGYRSGNCHCCDSCPRNWSATEL